MRITNNMLVNNMMNYIGNNLVRMDKYQNQLATGKKIQVPSDDPIVAARALKLRTDVAEVEQYKRNATDAQSWMDITETTLSNIGDVLQRARELSVQGANGSNTPEDTQKMAEEAKQLREQLIHLANTTYAGRYIFSGYKTNSPLVDEATGEFIIGVKNSEKIQYEIGIGDSIHINVPGGDLFNNGGNADGPGNAELTGNQAISSLTVTGGANDELNLTVDGHPISININASTYTKDTLAQEIQTKINAALPTGAPQVTVTADTGGVLTITSGSKGSGSNIDITGGNAAANLGLLRGVAAQTMNSIKGSTVGFPITVDSTNNQIIFNVAGTDRTFTIASGTYTTAADLANELQNKMSSSQITVSTMAGGGFLFSAGGTGASSNFTVTGGNGAAGIGLTAGMTGQSYASVQSGPISYPVIATDPANNKLNLNGTVYTLADGSYATADALASGIQSAVGTDATVSVTAAGKLQITSNTAGAASQMTVNMGADPTADIAQSLGLAAGMAVDGTAKVGKLVKDFDDLITMLTAGNHSGLDAFLGTMDADMNNLLRVRADIGARQNRIELTVNRLDSDNINFTKLMSYNEDVDMAETIMNLQNEENVYKASLAGGAKIIQPSLVDFLK